MAIVKDKVGVVSCSGEDLPEGTISRIATRIVLEKLRPNDTVTICLPLFLAGSEDERAFARVFPTIAIDGCDKRCAEVGTKKYSGKPVATIVVSEIMQKYPYLKAKSRGKLSAKEKELALKVAEEIAAKVDEVLERKKRGDSN
ncbi:MAG: putative zinc-binding protein [Candidatus Bathyarchaeota archaeon]|nr:putative zinc-binding protein [Candidatus Bathyarchaeota archaeon]MDH5745997.1 putative zinc-binding protein [Candidatus Bathyarchaeota archaeon]